MPSQKELVLLLAWGLGECGEVQTHPRSLTRWGFSASRLWCSGDHACESQESVLIKGQKQKPSYISPIYFKHDLGLWLATITPVTEEVKAKDL